MNSITLKNQIIDSLHTNWKDFFLQPSLDHLWAKILSTLTVEQTKFRILPETSKILSCFNFFNVKYTRVVIVGQDPYPNPMYPIGMSFAVSQNCPKLPESLKNIFQELKNDLGVDRNNGDLTGWAQQNILLLNRVLTVRKFQSNSHRNIGWSELTNEIIKLLNKYFEKIIYVLWGNQAKSLLPLIDQTKNYCICSAHPSPLSCHQGFFGSKPFSKINNYLANNHFPIIDWSK